MKETRAINGNRKGYTLLCRIKITVLTVWCYVKI